MRRLSGGAPSPRDGYRRKRKGVNGLTAEVCPGVTIPSHVPTVYRKHRRIKGGKRTPRG